MDLENSLCSYNADVKSLRPPVKTHSARREDKVITARLQVWMGCRRDGPLPGTAPTSGTISQRASVILKNVPSKDMSPPSLNMLSTCPLYGSGHTSSPAAYHCLSST